MVQTIPISADVAEKLKIVLNKYNFGLSSESILSFYKLVFPAGGKDLEWKYTGHYTFDRFLATAPPGCFKRELNCNNKWIYYGVDATEVPEQILDYRKMKEEANSDKTDVKVKQYEDVPVLNLGSMWDANKRLSVTVGEVYSPDFFWLIPAVDDSFKKFRTEMKKFYLQNMKGSWKINRFELKKNQIGVILLSDDIFHRVMITDFAEDGLLQVFLVDYGSLIRIPVDTMWYLHRQFLDFPAQAFMAQLSGIEAKRPNKYHWAKNSFARFMSMCDQTKLKAEYVSIGSDGVGVVLHDLNDSEGRTINQKLVYEQCADFIIPTGPTKSDLTKDWKAEAEGMISAGAAANMSTCNGAFLLTLGGDGVAAPSVDNNPAALPRLDHFAATSSANDNSATLPSLDDYFIPTSRLGNNSAASSSRDDRGASALPLPGVENDLNEKESAELKEFLMLQEYRREAFSTIQTCIDGFVQRRNVLLDTRARAKPDGDDTMVNCCYSLQQSIKSLRDIQKKFKPKYDFLSDEGACGFT